MSHLIAWAAYATGVAGLAYGTWFARTRRQGWCAIGLMVVALGVLLLMLSGCNPITSRKTNSPVPPTNLVLVSSTVTTTPVDSRTQLGPPAAIRYDGTETTGKARNRQGPAYPFEVIRSTPFTHEHYYEPGLILTLTVEAVLTGEPGQAIGCSFTDDGIEQIETRRAATIAAGDTAVSVRCTYTTPFRASR